MSIAGFIGSQRGVALNVGHLAAIVIVGCVLRWPPGYTLAATLWLSIEAILLTAFLQASQNRDTADIKRMLQALTVANPAIPDEIADCD